MRKVLKNRRNDKSLEIMTFQVFLFPDTFEYGNVQKQEKRQNPLNSAKPSPTGGTERPFRCLDIHNQNHKVLYTKSDSPTDLKVKEWAGESDYSPGDPSHPSTYCTTVLHLSKLSVSSLATKIEPITNIYNIKHKTFRHLVIALVETFGISLYCEIPTISLQWAIKSEDDPFQCQCSDEEAFLSGHNKRILQGKLGNLSVSKVEGFILVFYKL